MPVAAQEAPKKKKKPAAKASQAGARQAHARADPQVQRAAEEEQVVRYVSTRGGAAPKRFTEILLEGLAADGGLYVPEVAAAGAAGRAAGPRLPGARPRHPVALHGRRARPGRDRRAHLQRESVRLGGRHAAEDAGARAAPPRPVARARRSPSRTSRCSCSASCSSPAWRRKARRSTSSGATSGDTGSAAEYAMRGRRDIRVFMLSPHKRMSAVPARADVFAAGRQHPQPRGAGRVRRLPGHGEEGERRRRLQGAAPHRRGELDQLGARRRAGGLLLQGLFRGNARRPRAGLVRRALGQLRQHLRRLRRARGWACRSAG